VASVHFSENGYLLASATSLHAEIWDLRKLTKAGTIAVQSDEKTVVRFDPSAQLLAVVGKSVQIYANKTWQLLWTATDETHSSAVTDAKWTWTEGQLITSGMDRSVRTFAAT
jgi:WD40 repeat protein